MKELVLIVTAVIALCFVIAPVFGQNQSAEKKKEITPAEAKTADKVNVKTAGTNLLHKKEEYQQRAFVQSHS